MLVHRGFSLVELMVSLVAGLLVLAVAASLFVSALKGSSTTVRFTRLNQQMQAITDLIARDLQRAGYSANAVDRFRAMDANGNGILDENEITATVSDFVFDPIHDLGSLGDDASNHDCVLFRYDANDNGVLERGDFFGYRYNSHEQSVESGSPGSAWHSLASQSCTTGRWENLSDDQDLVITQMSFILIPSAATTVRAVKFVMSGQSRHGPALMMTVERIIRIQNDFWR